MKKSLFLYLFIIAALMMVFTYAYYSKKASSDEERFEASTRKMHDSITSLGSQLDDATYFSLARNENAKEYLEISDATDLVAKITNQIMDHNVNPKGNVLVPYDPMYDQRYIINKVKVLNHRWIIADFSDGKVWGELLLKYFVEEDGSITFERIDSQLYRPTVY